MMIKRQVLLGRGWLRRYLRDQLKVTVPLNADDDEWKHICDEISAKDWVRVKKAWRQHQHNDTPCHVQYIHADNEESKRLGLFWQRLIAQEFVTEEDALLLAENYFQGLGGYSDEMAKDMVRKILSGVADRYRTEATPTGEMYDGTQVSATDTMNTVGCNDNGSSAEKGDATSSGSAGAMNWMLMVGLGFLGLRRQNGRRNSNT